MHIVRIGGVLDRTAFRRRDRQQGRQSGADGALGLPVPPAFVLPVKLCAAIMTRMACRTRSARRLKEASVLESVTGKRFGDHRKPLLISVRSGAARSMRGMLDTVLNVAAVGRRAGPDPADRRPRLAWDCRRRFIESYTETCSASTPRLSPRASPN